MAIGITVDFGNCPLFDGIGFVAAFGDQSMSVRGAVFLDPDLQATAMQRWQSRVLTTLSFVDLLASLTSVRSSILRECGLHTSVGSTITSVFLSMNRFAC